MAAVTSQFTQNYQMLATAVDATRHELPVKNLHLEDNREQFLGQEVQVDITMIETDVYAHPCARLF